MEIWLGCGDKQIHRGQQVVYRETGACEEQLHYSQQLLTCCLWSLAAQYHAYWAASGEARQLPIYMQHLSLVLLTQQQWIFTCLLTCLIGFSNCTHSDWIPCVWGQDVILSLWRQTEGQMDRWPDGWMLPWEHSICVSSPTSSLHRCDSPSMIWSATQLTSCRPCRRGLCLPNERASICEQSMAERQNLNYSRRAPAPVHSSFFVTHCEFSRDVALSREKGGGRWTGGWRQMD